MSEPTEGRWTTEPPTVPGWYWCRYRGDSAPAFPSRHWGRYCVDVEWWSIPIQEPPR